MGLDEFQQSARDLLAVLGEQVTVVRGTAAPVTLLAFVDDGLQTVGDRAPIYANRRGLVMMRDDWLPLRGDSFTVRGKPAKVDEILHDDGVCVTVVLHG